MIWAQLICMPQLAEQAHFIISSAHLVNKKKEKLSAHMNSRVKIAQRLSEGQDKDRKGATKQKKKVETQNQEIIH